MVDLVGRLGASLSRWKSKKMAETARQEKQKGKLYKIVRMPGRIGKMPTSFLTAFLILTL